MNNINNLHKSIIEYICHEIAAVNYSADCLESLEVARQCLESVWGIECLKPSNELSKLFDPQFSDNADKQENNAEDVEIDEDDKMAAERLKAQGNICMGENLFTDAVSCYSKAIELHPRNAVYYCNRAAAYSKLNKNDCAIEDCRKALKIDSKYGKAYSRMGLAYTAMGNFDEAISCYKRAIEIEPDNQNYKQNLQAAEERRSGAPPPPTLPATNTSLPQIPNIQSALQNFDISSILNNPVMMNMAQQMISQPEMRNMMTQMMQTMMPGVAGGPPAGPAGAGSDGNQPTTGDTGVPNQPNIDDFLTFGQQMAQQMQSSNPELIDTLRNRFHENPPNAPDNSKEPPPNQQK